jgi:hypothetical protein
MGYSTDFNGAFDITTPLSPEQIKFIQMFSDTRRMQRNVSSIKSLDTKNEECIQLLTSLNIDLKFYCGNGFAGQDRDSSITDYNSSGIFPSLWCGWTVNNEGTLVIWNESEKFYEYVDWIKFLIDHFFKPWGKTLNGKMEWCGEDRKDRGQIVIKDNKVTVKVAKVTWVDEDDEDDYED